MSNEAGDTTERMTQARDGKSDAALAELGRRIHAYRRMRKVTLKQLAAHVGVSEGFLSQIERGASGASVTTLHLIAEAFQIRMADLFTDETNLMPQVLRNSDRPRMVFTGMTKRMMTRRPLQNLEVLQGDFDEGATVGGPENVHGDSQELLFILSGHFRLELGDGHVYDLYEQDSIEYRSSVSHRLTNAGPGAGQALWIISPPSL